MRRYKLIATLLLINSLLFAQKLEWEVGLHSFFDNTEFAGAEVQDDQTMAGVRLSPELGLSFDTVHRIHAGISAMQEFGSTKSVDHFVPIAYYNYTGRLFSFHMGAFPRKHAVEKYPRVFFQDSINYYRPVMTGFVLNMEKDKSNFNLWLDWTSRQTTSQRETFFAGWSGRWQWRDFYLQHFGYMFHYAKMKHAPEGQFIHDNCLFLTSAGMDLAEKTVLQKLQFNAGWLLGFEDNRGTTDWLKHHALLVEAEAEYRGIGLKNSFYAGERQMYFYAAEGNKLYWGDPIYRAELYNRTDISLVFFDTGKVNLKFVNTLHLLKSGVYHEHGLYACIELNNYKEIQKPNYRPFWSRKKK